jgi:hypothetical protein
MMGIAFIIEINIFRPPSRTGSAWIGRPTAASAAARRAPRTCAPPTRLAAAAAATQLAGGATMAPELGSDLARDKSYKTFLAISSILQHIKLLYLPLVSLFFSSLS